MKPYLVRGMTLIELLIGICILAVVVGTVLPHLGKIIEQHRQRAQVQELYRLLQLARGHAVNSGRTTTLCGSEDGTTCSADWINPTVLIFQDHNRNRRLDDNDTLLRSATLPRSQWHWRGSASRAYLRFRSDGSAIEWGRFTRCPTDAGQDYLPQLVLNRVGRTYQTTTQRTTVGSGLCADSSKG